MTPINQKRVARFHRERTIYGDEYRPADDTAKMLAALSGCGCIPEDRIRYVEALGFEVQDLSEQPMPAPLPFPRRASHLRLVASGPC